MTSLKESMLTLRTMAITSDRSLKHVYDQWVEGYIKQLEQYVNSHYNDEELADSISFNMGFLHARKLMLWFLRGTEK